MSVDLTPGLEGHNVYRFNSRTGGPQCLQGCSNARQCIATFNSFRVFVWEGAV